MPFSFAHLEASSKHQASFLIVSYFHNTFPVEPLFPVEMCVGMTKKSLDPQIFGKENSLNS